MHSVYHFYLVNQPNFVFIIFKISCSCALYSLHLECNLFPHLVIKIIIYIQSNFFRRYILISMIPILTNTNNTIKFTSRYSLITSPSTAIPEGLPSKNIWEILSHIFLYRFRAAPARSCSLIHFCSSDRRCSAEAIDSASAFRTIRLSDTEFLNIYCARVNSTVQCVQWNDGIYQFCIVPYFGSCLVITNRT